MEFKLIDLSKWSRKEYFDHYLNCTPCTYSMTLNLDITILLRAIKRKNIKLYPTTIYLLSTVVNRHEEFRTTIDEDGHLGVFDLMHPAYAVFHNDNETFTNIWTEYNFSFSKFYENYLSDLQRYGSVKRFLAKPDTPPNVFTISSIPWVSFSGFNLNLPKLGNYLLPIFTTGKYFDQNDRILLPISVQVHHAVCDGYHIARFINQLQEDMNKFASEIVDQFTEL
jgi:chloramphenicol O-acetyltransferase type A